MLPTEQIKPTPPELRSRIQKFIEWGREHDDGTSDAMRMNHIFHAGCYARTLFVPKGVIFASDCIKIETVLIVSGDAVFTDTEKAFRIQGYGVLTGAPMRQSIVRTLEDTYFTMVFATKAKTQEEAEAEFALHPDQLLSIKESPQ